MTTPVVNLNVLKLTGNRLNFQGDVDLGSDSGTTLSFFLDPQPSGTPLGPFPLTLAGVAYAQDNAPLGRGKWKVRLVATPTTGPVVEVVSPELSVIAAKCRMVLPVVGGGPGTSAPSDAVVIADPVTRLQYSVAIAAAAAGVKRLAGAAAIVQAMGNTARLLISRNNQLVLQAEYRTAFTVSNSNGVVAVKPPAVTDNTVFTAADINTGNWTFELQGGFGYSRILRGTVGADGSTKHITLAGSPELGTGFASDFLFVLPAGMDS
jgi:hypothetical protein